MSSDLRSFSLFFSRVFFILEINELLFFNSRRILNQFFRGLLMPRHFFGGLDGVSGKLIISRKYRVLSGEDEDDDDTERALLVDGIGRHDEAVLSYVFIGFTMEKFSTESSLDTSSSAATVTLGNASFLNLCLLKGLRKSLSSKWSEQITFVLYRVVGESLSRAALPIKNYYISLT